MILDIIKPDSGHIGVLGGPMTEEKKGRIGYLPEERGLYEDMTLLVSLRPFHMPAGKLAGLGALTFVQYLAWGVIAALALTITGQDPAQLLSGISLSMQEAALVVPYALGGFLLYAGLMAGIGALAPDLEGSRTWVFIISLPMMIPIYLWMSIVNAPNGPLAVTLSMIPFSAPVAMLMRMTTTAVPEWQLLTSLLLLLLNGVGMVWLMARLFRVKTLLSGESLSVRRFLGALQGS